MNRPDAPAPSAGFSLFGTLRDDREIELRTAVVNAALIGTVIFSIPAVIMETIRALQIGILPLNYVHMVVDGIIFATALLRRHIGYQTKAILVLTYLVVMAISATLTFGTAPGVSFLSAFCIMFGVFYGFRATMIALVGSMLGLLALYLLPYYGVLPWPQTPSYSLFGVWATNVAGFAFVVYGPISAMHTFRSAIERQRADAERVANEQSQLLERYIASVEATQKAVEGERTARAESERILSGTTDGFLTFDADWRLVYANKPAEHLLDFKTAAWLGSIAEKDHYAWQPGGLLDRILRAAHGDGPAEFDIYHEPGGRWLEVRVFPSEANVSVYVRDISFNVEAERRMRELQKMETIGQLSGGIAHDFNNLLTIVIGSSETLAEQLDEPAQKKLAELILRASERGGQLTRQLLAFARRQPLEPRSFDVGAMIEAAEPLIRRGIGGAVELAIDNPPDMAPAYADPAQTEAAILNLCINARDAMPDGGLLTITIENVAFSEEFAAGQVEVRAGNYVAIRISDTGTGIPPDVVDHIFEPFFTTKERGRGTGLGLSMVYGFVKQSGGYVDLDTELGAGTVFTLYLPASDSNVDSDDQRIHEGEIEGGNENVLIVEDDDLVRAHVRTQLEGLGYQVVEAADGPTALAILEVRDDIDLLFTDIIMPGGMNGRELGKRAAARWRHLRVLYTSGYTSDALTADGRLLEGVTLLSKPYSKRQLSEKVRKVLDEV
jgi:signal transduction histidine kinase